MINDKEIHRVLSAVLAVSLLVACGAQETEEDVSAETSLNKEASSEESTEKMVVHESVMFGGPPVQKEEDSTEEKSLNEIQAEKKEHRDSG